MRYLLLALVGQVLLVSQPSLAQVAPLSPSLRPFRSERELSQYLSTIARAQARRMPGKSCKATSTSKSLRIPAQDLAEPSGRRGSVVQGTVRDRSGLPLHHARVQVIELDLSAMTDSTGRYRITIPAARLTRARMMSIMARTIGYASLTQVIRVSPGQGRDVSFAMCAQPFALNEVVATAAPSEGESITNTQHAGVDEGGIVKLHGDHLVVLRRGRLFTLSIGGARMESVASVPAHAPDMETSADWYDELIVHGNKAVVIGYSYRRGGTEIVLFRIEPSGQLRYLSTHHLRSNDYYSSRNYAGRLVGGKLVFYTPLYFPPGTENPLEALPAIRRWHPDAGEGEFRRIATWRRVYRAEGRLDQLDWVALHTVTVCGLDKDLDCEATVVVGPAGRVFYASPGSAYVWSTDWRTTDRWDAAGSMLFRLPFDGSRPGMLEVSGSPVDQFSFLEGDDGFLNVMVLSAAGGDAMWQAERRRGRPALLRFPVRDFGRLIRLSPDRYRPLPELGPGTLHNRFVGNRLLYGAGNGWGDARIRSSHLYAVDITGPGEEQLGLPHGIDRIEPMGRDAVVIGTDGNDLHFRAIHLDGPATLGSEFVRPNAAQGELRSHGFFYRPDGPDTGTFGLPIRAGGKPGWEHLIHGSASVLFVRNAEGRFDAIGELQAAETEPRPDGCRTSCVDWYGNARPLFLRGRSFALLGYELVEGEVKGNRIREVGRLDFTPAMVSRR